MLSDTEVYAIEKLTARHRLCGRAYDEIKQFNIQKNPLPNCESSVIISNEDTFIVMYVKTRLVDDSNEQIVYNTMDSEALQLLQFANSFLAKSNQTLFVTALQYGPSFLQLLFAGMNELLLFKNTYAGVSALVGEHIVSDPSSEEFAASRCKVFAVIRDKEVLGFRGYGRIDKFQELLMSAVAVAEQYMKSCSGSEEK